MSLLGTLHRPDNAAAQSDAQPLLVNMAGSTPSRETVELDRDWLLKLATALQTTLDVERLIALFAKHASEVLDHDAVRFVGPDQALVVTTGEDAQHTYSYELVLHGHPLGTITFSRAHPFSGDETRRLEDILANLVQPIKNALMYREALRAAAKDPLTGVANRTHLDTVLEREMELTRRHGTELTVVMADIDHFKRINDEFGHLAGDRTLKAVADCLSGCTRDSDMVFRYGGEEFCVVLSRTALDGAALLAERIREAVQALRVPTREQEISVTVSLGVAAFDGAQSMNALVEQVDAALYQSKHLGRNKVSVASAGDPSRA